MVEGVWERLRWRFGGGKAVREWLGRGFGGRVGCVLQALVRFW